MAGRTLVLAFFLGFGAVAANAAEPKRVLLIHSFGRDFAPLNEVASGFRTELATRSPEPLDIYEVSLESARFKVPPHEQAVVGYLSAMFDVNLPDLVVTIGGPAVRFSQQYRRDLFESTPLIFGGVDERHLNFASVTDNDTVVAVRNDPRRMIEQILAILPRTSHIAVVVGNSPLENFWLEELRRDFAPFTDRVTFEWMQELSLPEIVKRCADLPQHSAIFFGVFVIDADGVPYLEQESLDQLYSAANAPIFGLHTTQLGRGIVGGPLMNLGQTSRTMAEVAVRILNGESPAQVDVPVQQPGRPMFDSRVLRRWGIRPAQLPPESLILFNQPGIWEQYWGRIILAVALVLGQAFLILMLLRNLSRRRKAEASLRESQEWLNLAAAAADVGVWHWNVATNQVWATSGWRKMFGFLKDAEVNYDALIQRIHPDDRDSVKNAMRHALRENVDYSAEFRVNMPDSSQRWITARGKSSPGGAWDQVRLMGVDVDITERKHSEDAARDFSRRLIETQEKERARLARELHDDITQRLARLAIDVGRCEQEQAPSPQVPQATAREVREGLVRLCEDVHSLSYRLHPAILEELGLPAALRAECERFTQQTGIETYLNAEGLSDARDVPRDVAICLFRVTQEALRNVSRHANARNVRVTLRSADGGLQLALRDDGQGFDPSQPARQATLGLASMRERVHLALGEMEIESTPGQGTHIMVWVPLTEVSS